MPTPKKVERSVFPSRMSERGLTLVAPAFVLAWAWWWHPAVADDAFITFRYAQNWAAGEGLTFNPGAPPVEGYTNFLWLVIAAAGLWLGAGPITLMPVIGSVCAAATCTVLNRAMRRLLPQGPTVWWLLPGLLVAANPLFGLWAVSGMETCLTTLCITGGVCSALKWQGRAHWATAAWLLAAALTRPDAVLWAVVIGVWLLRVDPRRAPLQFAVPFALGFALYWLWRWHHFGAMWPNTLAAKSGARGALVVMGVRALGWGLLRHSPISFLFLVCMVLADEMQKWRQPDPTSRVPGLVWISAAVWVHLLHLIWIGGDAFHGDRFLMPALPAMALLGAWSLWRCGLSARGAQRIGLLFTVLMVLLPLREAARAHRQTRVAQWRWTCVGQWLDRHAPDGTRVALNPIGAVGFHAPDIVIVDMLGLTDPVIAAGPVRDEEQWLPPGHRKGSGERVLELDPDVILINNVWLQPQRLESWAPFYASEAELFESRAYWMGSYEVLHFRIREREWPDNLPRYVLPEGVETLWLSVLAKPGVLSPSGLDPIRHRRAQRR